MPEDDVAEEIEDTPSWVNEGTAEDTASFDGEDISSSAQMEPQPDVLEPAKGVEFIIEKVDVDIYTPTGESDWKTARIKPWLKIGPKGVDGKGRYAGKYFFPRMLVAVNRASKAYDFSVNAAGKPTDYYSPGGNAFGDYNAFLQGLGIKTNPAPKNDAAFRKSLVGRTVTADITKDRKQVKNSQTGKYERVDEYENILIYKAGKPAAASTEVVAEAAAS